MLARLILLSVSLFTACALPCLPITFTGDVDVDFVGPGVGEYRDPAGCADPPMSPGAFEDPVPSHAEIGPNGFNQERFVWLWDCENDVLYIGIDICDSQILWDADGDGDPLYITPGIVPGYTLDSLFFSDRGTEDYTLVLDLDNDCISDFTICARSEDGNPATAAVTIAVNTSGLTLHASNIAGPDVEFAIEGLKAKGLDRIWIGVKSGSLDDLSGPEINRAGVPLPGPCIQITKAVSCYPEGPWAASTDVLRGADVYFKITVTNCGNEDLENVEVTDVLDGTGYVGSISSPIVIGDLAVGASWEQVYVVGTDPAYSDRTKDTDFWSLARASAVGAISGQTVSAGPAEAEVNILVPSITCSKLADDDGDFSEHPKDKTPPTTDLRLDGDGMNDIEEVWFKLCVNNDGEVDVDFVPSDGDCPDFWDPFLEIEDPTIPGTGVDIDAEFLAAIESEFGGTKLPAGESVCIVVGPVVFNESELCPARRVFLNRFQACGIAWEEDICLPDAGGEVVSTGICEAAVSICVSVDDLTRTPGYWMTHPRALQYAINKMYEETGGAGYRLVDLFGTYTFPCPPHCAILGNTPIPDINVPTCEGKLAWELLSTNPGRQPTPNLHAAAILEFHLIAGLANVLTLDAGSIVVDGTTLAQLVTDALALTADCMISDDEIDAALMIAEKIAWASNDPIAHDRQLPDGFPAFKAEPKFFKNLNCMGCPDNPPMP